MYELKTVKRVFHYDKTLSPRIEYEVHMDRLQERCRDLVEKDIKRFDHKVSKLVTATSGETEKSKMYDVRSILYSTDGCGDASCAVRIRLTMHELPEEQQKMLAEELKSFHCRMKEFVSAATDTSGDS